MGLVLWASPSLPCCIRSVGHVKVWLKSTPATRARMKPCAKLPGSQLPMRSISEVRLPTFGTSEPSRNSAVLVIAELLLAVCCSWWLHWWLASTPSSVELQTVESVLHVARCLRPDDLTWIGCVGGGGPASSMPPSSRSASSQSELHMVLSVPARIRSQPFLAPSGSSVASSACVLLAAASLVVSPSSVANARSTRDRQAITTPV
mmetsp:Transcript_64655/g.166382  ORF Transcript_64655/g.166382 Transcript_64655/m.166382 type:complete len:205 (+) Transcript_64655:747-1361(+)